MAKSNGHSNTPLPKGWGSKANKAAQRLALLLIRAAQKSGNKKHRNN